MIRRPGPGVLSVPVPRVFLVASWAYHLASVHKKTEGPGYEGLGFAVVIALALARKSHRNGLEPKVAVWIREWAWGLITRVCADEPGLGLPSEPTAL